MKNETHGGRERRNDVPAGLSTERWLYLCRHWHSLTGLPVRLFRSDSDAPVLTVPEFDPDCDPAAGYLPQLLGGTFHVSHRITPQMIAYGCIRELRGPHAVFIGPAHRTRISGLLAKEVLANARGMLCEAQASTDMGNAAFDASGCTLPGRRPRLPARLRSDRAETLLGTCQPCDFEHFIPLLCLIDSHVNDEALSMDEVIRHGAPAAAASAVPDRTLRAAHADSLMLAQEAAQGHHDMTYERRLLSCIREGSMDALTKFESIPIPGHVGTMAADAMRQSRNMFIAITTMATRAAIDGGLDAETALHLSDVYIQQVERLTRLEGVQLLHRQMLMDFTRRVAACRHEPPHSPLIAGALAWMRLQVGRSLPVAEIAAHMGVSASHLTRQFRAETGHSPAQRMLHMKVEEAKNLLAYTDRTLGDIAGHLGFSSQSHFQNTFRRIAGQTPAAWRRQAERGS